MENVSKEDQKRADEFLAQVMELGEKQIDSDDFEPTKKKDKSKRILVTVGTAIVIIGTLIASTLISNLRYTIAPNAHPVAYLNIEAGSELTGGIKGSNDLGSVQARDEEPHTSIAPNPSAQSVVTTMPETDADNTESTNDENVIVSDDDSYRAYETDFLGTKQIMSNTQLCQSFTEVGLGCEIRWLNDSSSKANTLLNQSVAAGTKVKKGTVVVLSYSLGAEQVKVPHLVGRNIGDVSQDLFDSGLKVGKVNYVDAAGKADGTIVSASAKEDELLANASAIDLTIATGKLETPNWVGKTREFVEAEAAKNGIEVNFVEQESDKTVNTVLSQEPKAGEISNDGVVTVTVATPINVKEISVPDVVSKTAEQAQVDLAIAGFTKITTVKVSNCKVDKTQVTQTVPKAGSKTLSSTEIVMIVSEPDEKCKK